jgi:putative FmdB family regulatory protein
MPNYEYLCHACHHTFEEFFKIDDRKKPEKRKCPACGEKKVKQECLTAPGMAMDPSMDVTRKASGGFKDVMEKTLKGIKGTQAERYWKNRYGL